MREFGAERKPPVKVGEIRTVRIEAMGSGGDGIAKVNGYVIFVPGTQLNDEVTIRVTKVLRKYGFAEVIE
ncbi:MAG: TRAM domain-containing protein [Archaeoglobaceae archaeon]